MPSTDLVPSHWFLNIPGKGLAAPYTLVCSSPKYNWGQNSENYLKMIKKEVLM